MSAVWVAGGVRARALLTRRLGRAGARRLAATGGLAQALALLAESPYRRGLGPDSSVVEAEHAIAASLLWQLRVLAGWQPRPGVEVVRLLAGWFVLENIIEHRRGLDGTPGSAPYALGALDLGWARLSTTSTPAQLRTSMAGSAWRDPGGTAPAEIALAGRLRWAALVADGIPTAAEWVAAAVAVLAATAWFLAEEPPPEAMARRVAALVGADPRAAGSLAEFTAALRPGSRWALSGVTTPDHLWQAEARWWGGVERDAAKLMHGARFRGPQLAGCVALLAVDAWRVRAALQAAVAPGDDAVAVFDALG